MKLQVVSDLHLEFDPAWRLPATEADVLILAGDIHPGLHGMTSFSRLGRPTIYVPGNHEFYGEHIDGLSAAMRLYAKPAKIHILNNDELVIDGVRFLGTTLWTDFRLFGIEALEEALLAADGQMNDYISIRNGTGYITPQDTLMLHLDAVNWLEEKLEEYFPGPTVIVTHHAPHPGSQHPKYAGHILNSSFVSDLTRLLGKAQLWIHGHIHCSLDYEVNGTRIICNPKGYRDENKSFRPDLVIEVEQMASKKAAAGGGRRR